MKTAPKMLLTLACLSASAFTWGHKGPAVRKVTIYPLTNYFSYEAIPHKSVADSIEASHSEYFSMTVTVSDDPGKTYSIDCLAYRMWDHCRLPTASSYGAEISSDTIRITAVEDNKKHTTYKVKYRITSIQANTTPNP